MRKRRNELPQTRSKLDMACRAMKQIYEEVRLRSQNEAKPDVALEAMKKNEKIEYLERQNDSLLATVTTLKAKYVSLEDKVTMLISRLPGPPNSS
jgi:seryl-tRNA synthetase